MEKTYKKIIIGLIILVTLLLAGLGYFIYKSFNKEESKGFRVVVSSINSYVNEKVSLKAYIYTDGIELSNITFTVKDTSVASITNYEVTLLKEGTTTIEANYKKIKETIIVNVSKVEVVNEDEIEDDASVIIDDNSDSLESYDNVYKISNMPTNYTDGKFRYTYGSTLKVVMGNEIEATMEKDVVNTNTAWEYSKLKLKIGNSSEIEVNKIRRNDFYSIFKYHEMYIFTYIPAGSQCQTQITYIYDKYGNLLKSFDANTLMDGNFRFTFNDDGIIEVEEYTCALFTCEDKGNTGTYSKKQKYRFSGISLVLLETKNVTFGEKCSASNN